MYYDFLIAVGVPLGYIALVLAALWLLLSNRTRRRVRAYIVEGSPALVTYCGKQWVTEHDVVLFRNTWYRLVSKNVLIVDTPFRARRFGVFD